MRTIETIRTIKAGRFSVRVTAVEDNDLDLSWDDDGSARAGLESGELMHFGVVATCYLDGRELANDSLWQCIYKTPADFMDHIGLKAKSRADGRNYGSYFSDMVRNVCRDARIAVSDMAAIKLRPVKA